MFTSQGQACWQERLQKEAAARATWKIKYGHKYLTERTVTRKRLLQGPCGPASVAGPMQGTCSPDKEVRVEQPETKRVLNQPSRGVGVQGPPAKGDRVWEARRAAQRPAGQTRPPGLAMRPVPPSTLQLLFQGLSHEGQGRAQYLRERHRQKPEEKFQYPVLSSWEYGWHVGDAMRDPKPPTYAKIQPITKVFYMESGIFHFPRRTDQLM